MENTSSNKTSILSKSMNIDIYVISTSNQHRTWGSQTETKFSKKEVTGKTFAICSPFYLS